MMMKTVSLMWAKAVEMSGNEWLAATMQWLKKVEVGAWSPSPARILAVVVVVLENHFIMFQVQYWPLCQISSGSDEKKNTAV